jgi:hypothetical protein
MVNREATDLDRRRWRSKVTIPKVKKSIRTLCYPEWVLEMKNLEKTNRIPTRETTQFWKERLDNKAASKAHDCKSTSKVKEIACKLYWTESARGKTR